MHPFEDVQGYAGLTARNRGVCAVRFPLQSLSVCAPMKYTVSDFECASF